MELLNSLLDKVFIQCPIIKIFVQAVVLKIVELMLHQDQKTKSNIFKLITDVKNNS